MNELMKLYSNTYHPHVTMEVHNSSVDGFSTETPCFTVFFSFSTNPALSIESLVLTQHFTGGVFYFGSATVLQF